MRAQQTHTAATLGRRRLILGTAGTLAGVALAHAAAPPLAGAAARPLPAPKPIPGGLALPDGLIHVFAPGPQEVTLPFTGFQLQGLHVEPNTITDFEGITAVAFHVGTATGSDGTSYNLETDMCAYQGTYLAEDGSRRSGTFAFI